MSTPPPLYRLSPVQRAYVRQPPSWVVLPLPGVGDDVLRQALDALAVRHPALCTALQPHPGGGLWVAALAPARQVTPSEDQLRLSAALSDLRGAEILRRELDALVAGRALPPADPAFLDLVPHLNAVGAAGGPPEPAPALPGWLSHAAGGSWSTHPLADGDVAASFARELGHPSVPEAVLWLWAQVADEASLGGVGVWCDRRTPELAHTVGPLTIPLALPPDAATTPAGVASARRALLDRAQRGEPPEATGAGFRSGIPPRIRWHDTTHALCLCVDADHRVSLRVDASRVDPASAAFLAERVAVRLRGEGPLGPRERAFVRRALHGSDVEIGTVPLLDQVRAHARRAPQAVAVRTMADAWSYPQLVARCDARTAGLVAAGVRPGDVVALQLERSAERLCCTLAVLACGATLLPLEPGLPPGRLARMLEEARPVLAITTTPLPGPISVVAPEALEGSAPPPRIEVGGQDPAYIIYTSGSTGTPRGVVVPHEALHNHLQWRQDVVPLAPHHRFLHKAAASFDISLWEVLSPLTAGACCAPAPRGAERDPRALLEALCALEITHAHFSPTLLRLFIDLPGVEACRGTLQHVFCGGEPLPPGLVERVCERLGDVSLHNQYGPTECTIDVTLHPCTRGADRVPLGRPAHNTRLSIRDARGDPCGIGGIGELCVAGAPVASGYLGQPEQTAERFVDTAEGRLYRTGDLACLTPASELVFHGRADRQVKVAGHRIELGELEHHLRACAGVRDACVDLREHDTQLIAWVVADQLDEGALRTALAAHLPAVVCPHRLIRVDALPLGPHGKVAPSALQLPAPPHAPRAAALGDAEAAVIAAFEEVLSSAGVEPDASFFALGGDSIRTIQLIRHLERHGWRVTVRDVLELQTPRALADAIVSGGASAPLPPPPGVSASARAALPPGITRPAPLSAMQALMVDAARSDTAREGLYHVQAAYQLQHPTLTTDALQAAVDEMLAHHPALRLRLYPTPEGPIQALAEPVRCALTDLRALPPPAQHQWMRAWLEHDLQAPFGATAPLIRAHLGVIDAQAWILCLTNHHAIRDGWGREILLNQIFSRALGGGPPPPDAGSFYEFLALEQEMRSDPAAQRFWSEQLRDHTPPRAHEPVAGDRPGLARAQLGSGRALAERAREAGVSLKACVLTGILIRRRQAGHSPTVGVVANGRSPRLTDPLGSLGLFWNLVPFHVHDDVPTVAEVHAQLLRIEPLATYPLTAMHADPTQLFDETFNFVHFHHRRRPAGLQVEELHFHDRFHFPRNLVASWGDDETLTLQLCARPGVLDDAGASRELEQLCAILEAMATSPLA